MELLLPTLLVLFVTSIFWFTELDLVVASYFYRPESSSQWPLGNLPVWQAFYYGIPIMTGVVCITALLFIFCASFGLSFCLRRRPQAIFLLLVFVIGPGVLVNAVFKDNWGRARPRQVEALGGQYMYTPPLKMTLETAGKLKSFPAGHASAGFAFIAFWFLLRRRYSKWGLTVLGGALLFGSLAGIGRLSAGGHFLSDVIWAAYLPFVAAWFLFHILLQTDKRIKQAEQLSVHDLNPRPKLSRYLSLTAILIVLVSVSLSIPFQHEKKSTLRKDEIKGLSQTLQLNVSHGNLLIKVHKDPPSPLVINSHAQGFGLPTNYVDESFETSSLSISYTFEKKGFFTEFDNQIVIDVSSTIINKIAGNVGSGNITVLFDDGVTSTPSLKLRTEDGILTQP